MSVTSPLAGPLLGAGRGAGAKPAPALAAALKPALAKAAQPLGGGVRKEVACAGGGRPAEESLTSSLEGPHPAVQKGVSEVGPPRRLAAVVAR